MVCIDLQIPLGLHLKVDQSVFGKKDQHMVKKTNSGVDRMLAGAIEVDFQSDLRFGRLAFKLAGAMGCHLGFSSTNSGRSANYALKRSDHQQHPLDRFKPAMNL
jgi:hypothetical protein